jgi:SAM-dependent methyltransferase
MSKAKPSHLGLQYAAQFRDESVARAYAARPPYPDEVFEILISLMPGRARQVLELGCGTGDLTLKLAKRVDRIDAVDFSEAMLAVAHKRAGADQANLSWHHMPAESFWSTCKYGLVCAGASLHWMDWPVLVPRVRSMLAKGGFLAIADRYVVKRPWENAVADLIPIYSTNREFEPYDLVEELSSRELFTEIGRRETVPVPFSQAVDTYVESFHSSNGFSRERMDREAAAAFDEALREIAVPWSQNGVISGKVVGRVIWGRP